MKTKLLTLFIAAILVLPPVAAANEHDKKDQENRSKDTTKQQIAKNKAFRKTLKNIPEAEREAAIIAHRNSQFEENMSRFTRRHNERMAKWQSRFAENQKMTEAQKNDILAKAEQEFQNKITQAKTEHDNNIAYFLKVKNDHHLNNEQKRAALKEYAQSQRAAHQQARKEKIAKQKAHRNEYRLSDRGDNPNVK